MNNKWYQKFRVSYQSWCYSDKVAENGITQLVYSWEWEDRKNAGDRESMRPVSVRWGHTRQSCTTKFTVWVSQTLLKSLVSVVDRFEFGCNVEKKCKYNKVSWNIKYNFNILNL